MVELRRPQTEAGVRTDERHSQLKQMLNERNLCHMYLDTRGKVTVGVRHMLPSCAEVEKLAFVLRGSSVQQTHSKLKPTITKYSHNPTEMLAAKYLPFTALEMRGLEIDDLLDLISGRLKTGCAPLSAVTKIIRGRARRSFGYRV